MNGKLTETENFLKWLDSTFEYCKFGKPPLSIEGWICLHGGWVSYVLSSNPLLIDWKCEQCADLLQIFGDREMLWAFSWNNDLFKFRRQVLRPIVSLTLCQSFCTDIKHNGKRFFSLLFKKSYSIFKKSCSKIIWNLNYDYTKQTFLLFYTS